MGVGVEQDGRVEQREVVRGGGRGGDQVADRARQGAVDKFGVGKVGVGVEVPQAGDTGRSKRRVRVLGSPGPAGGLLAPDPPENEQLVIAGQSACTSPITAICSPPAIPLRLPLDVTRPASRPLRRPLARSHRPNRLLPDPPAHPDSVPATNDHSKQYTLRTYMLATVPETPRNPVYGPAATRSDPRVVLVSLPGRTVLSC